MNLSSSHTIVMWLLVFACATARAVVPDATDDDAQTRINPEMGASQPAAGSARSHYPFINTSKNVVEMNGDSWSSLAAILAHTAKGQQLNIVHIGDSHIQADGNTGKVRSLLQNEYGDAGRGLMIPYRIAGTNQPLDYKLTATGIGATASLLKTPWKTDMGFTGISLKPGSQSTFHLESPTPFTILKIYGKGSFSVSDVALGAASNEVHQTDHPWGCLLVFAEPVKVVDITLAGSDYNIFGFDARRSERHGGVVYHAIGNNGATYGTYNQIGKMGESLRQLDPDLVILSLGTNEAFGKMTDQAFKSSIDRLVEDIRRHNPDAKFLLTTPSECQRSVYVRSRRKGRRRARSTRTYQVNTNVKRMRNLILEYGRENDIPTYDFYDVAGGDGASAKWLQAKLLGADRIHRTWQGYYTEGELLFNALNEALTLKSETIRAVDIPVAKGVKSLKADSAANRQVKVTPAPKKTSSTATKKKRRTSKKRTKRRR